VGDAVSPAGDRRAKWKLTTIKHCLHPLACPPVPKPVIRKLITSRIILEIQNRQAKLKSTTLHVLQKDRHMVDESGAWHGRGARCLIVFYSGLFIYSLGVVSASGIQNKKNTCLPPYQKRLVFALFIAVFD
jgi:hypothetical protein